MKIQYVPAHPTTLQWPHQPCLHEHFIILSSVSIHSLCFSTSSLSRFHLLFPFLRAGQSPCFCSASPPPSPISALSPPSLQLSLSFLSACPPICWSCPDNSAEGRSSPLAPSLSPDVPPLRCLSIRLFFLFSRLPPSPCFPFLQPHSTSFIHLSPSPHKAIHSSCIYPSSQLLVPGSSQPSPDPTAVGSKCRGDRAWAKISSPRRSLSIYQLIGINLHPRILLLLLCFFLSVTGPLCCFIFPLTKNPPFFFWGSAKKSLRRTPPTPFYSSYNIWMVFFLCHILFSTHHWVLCKDARNMSDLSLILHIWADKNSIKTSKEPRPLDVISRLAAVLLASVTQCNLALMVSYICFSKMEHVPRIYYPCSQINDYLFVWILNEIGWKIRGRKSCFQISCTALAYLIWTKLKAMICSLGKQFGRMHKTADGTSRSAYIECNTSVALRLAVMFPHVVLKQHYVVNCILWEFLAAAQLSWIQISAHHNNVMTLILKCL